MMLQDEFRNCEIQMGCMRFGLMKQGSNGD